VDAPLLPREGAQRPHLARPRARMDRQPQRRQGPDDGSALPLLVQPALEKLLRLQPDAPRGQEGMGVHRPDGRRARTARNGLQPGAPQAARKRRRPRPAGVAHRLSRDAACRRAHAQVPRRAVRRPRHRHRRDVRRPDLRDDRTRQRPRDRKRPRPQELQLLGADRDRQPGRARRDRRPREGGQEDPGLLPHPGRRRLLHRHLRSPDDARGPVPLQADRPRRPRRVRKVHRPREGTAQALADARRRPPQLRGLRRRDPADPHLLPAPRLQREGAVQAGSPRDPSARRERLEGQAVPAPVHRADATRDGHRHRDAPEQARHRAPPRPGDDRARQEDPRHPGARSVLGQERHARRAAREARPGPVLRLDAAPHRHLPRHPRDRLRRPQELPRRAPRPHHVLEREQLRRRRLQGRHRPRPGRLPRPLLRVRQEGRLERRQPIPHRLPLDVRQDRRGTLHPRPRHRPTARRRTRTPRHQRARTRLPRQPAVPRRLLRTPAGAPLRMAARQLASRPTRARLLLPVGTSRQRRHQPRRPRRTSPPRAPSTATAR
jgi:hypothetical protein